MEVHHIFIFADNEEEAANELIEFGFTEGSNRIHPGQGTQNRKFHFENFYLELLWVSDEAEIKSERTAPAKLWERANHKMSGFSPFGMCLSNSEATDELFEGCFKYQPIFLPDHLAIDLITNEDRPWLPWTFRLPNFGPMLISKEPINRQRLTGLKFAIPNSAKDHEFTAYFKQTNIFFETGDQYNLTLEFDYKKNSSVKKFKSIPLTIAY